MKDVARHHDEIRPLREQVVHRAPERLGDVRFALVTPARRLPVELPEPEVEVGEVGELHGPPMRLSAPSSSSSPAAPCSSPSPGRRSPRLSSRCASCRPWSCAPPLPGAARDRKSTRLNSSHSSISYAVFCLKKKKTKCIIFFFANISNKQDI